MNDTPKRKVNEVSDIHPLVAVWLTKNGYSYIHEYAMPDFGRVDFYATHSDGHTLLVEVKGDELGKVITQLAGYGVQIPNARLAIAAPQNVITDKIRTVASKYNIGVIDIDVDYETLNKDSSIAFLSTKVVSLQAVNTDSMVRNPNAVIEAVKAWHKARGSYAFIDLLVLKMAVGQTSPNVYPDSLVFAAQEVYYEALFNAFFEITSDFSFEEEGGAIAFYKEILLKTEGVTALPRIGGKSSWSDLK